MQGKRTSAPAAPFTKPGLIGQLGLKSRRYAGIPEFQAIGTQVGQMVAAALTGQMSVEQALDAAQRSTERTMQQAGYPK